METGLYYYGARYLDAKTSRWMSADPALGEYIPGVPINDEVKKQNQNLPGMGGVFNVVNMHLYHYGANNPIRYLDPDGMFTHDETEGIFTADYNSNEDIIAATAAKIAYDEEHGTNSMIWLSDEGFISHATNSVDDITGFLQDRNLTSEDIINGIKNGLEFIGNVAFGATGLTQFPALAGFADKLSTGAGLVVSAINLAEFINNPNLDTGSDLAISASAFIPGVGPLVSAELAAGKEAGKAVSEGFMKIEMARRRDPIGFFTSIFSLRRTSK